jgi:UPF0716 protein FxsA
VWKRMSRNMVVVSQRSAGFSYTRDPPPRREGPKVVDLDADDFSHEPDPDSPWAGKDKPGNEDKPK